MTAAAAVVRDTVGDRRAPRLALVLGSGLGGFADAVQDVGGELTVTPRDEVTVETVREPPELEYAEPVPEPGQSGDQTQ